jgi:hypothetical protein
VRQGQILKNGLPLWDLISATKDGLPFVKRDNMQRTFHTDLFRTPKATFCAKSGLKKVEAEQTSERYGSKPAAR